MKSPSVRALTAYAMLGLVSCSQVFGYDEVSFDQDAAGAHAGSGGHAGGWDAGTDTSHTVGRGGRGRNWGKRGCWRGARRLS
jgi:hypothetical protein